MGIVLFEIGGGFVISAFWTLWSRVHACQQLHHRTKDEPRGLTDRLMRRSQQFQQWECLDWMASHHEDAEVRAEASTLLKLDRRYYSLFAIGAIFMVAGVIAM